MASTTAAAAVSPTPHSNRRRTSPAFGLAAPATLFVVLGLLGPLALMFRYSFNRFVPGELMASALTLENYAKFIHDSFYQQVLLTTLWMSALSTLLCLIAGFPVAYFMVRLASARWRSLMFILIILPLLMGNAVRTAAWMVVLGDKGLLSSAMAAIGLSPVKLMYTPTAVVIGLVSVLLPFMIVTIQSVLEGIGRNLEDAAESLAGTVGGLLVAHSLIALPWTVRLVTASLTGADRSIEEAAASLGASAFTVFRRITLPSIRSGVIAAALFSFVISFIDLEKSLFLVGPGRTTLQIALVNYLEWNLDSTVAAVATVQIFIIGTLLVISDRYAKLSRVF